MLIGARLDEADFRGADLRGADLSRGRFHSADFRGAILDRARFDGADCAGARFDEGAGPYADVTAKTGKESATGFDQVAITALREGLTTLPSMFTVREGATSELFDHILHVVETLGAMAAHPSEEWKPWLESLQSVFAMRDGNTPEELLDRLQHALDTLDAASDQPPEDWKPWLEPLIRATQVGKPLDLKALLDALSTLAQGRPAKGGEPTSS